MHIVHGELRKAPYIKSGVGQDGQSTLFIVELSEMTKDRQTGEKTYANYSAAIFAKSPAQIDYYTSALVEGNFIVINCEKLRVEVKEYKGKDYITLQMEGARLEGAQYIQDSAGGQATAPAPQQAMQQAPQQRAPMQQAPQPAQQPMQAPQSGHKAIVDEYYKLPNQEAKNAMWAKLNEDQKQAVIDNDVPF